MPFQVRHGATLGGIAASLHSNCTFEILSPKGTESRQIQTEFLGPSVAKAPLEGPWRAPRSAWGLPKVPGQSCCGSALGE